MAYLLDQNSSITTEIRRVLRELLLDAAGRAGSPGENVHDDVHEVRKSLKKARAVLKIVRPHVADYTARKDRYRDLGRRLSDVRDRAAVIESLDLFAGELTEHVSAERVATLQEQLVAKRDAVESEARDLLRGLHDDLQTAISEVGTLQLAETGRAVLDAGFRREYRRGRAWSRSLHTEASATEFHEWRKRAKEHRYHLELMFGEAQPVERMHALTDTLGHIQDLTVLVEVVDGAWALDDVVDALDALRKRRKASALEMGRAYYEPTPQNKLAEVMDLWRN